MKSMSPSLPNVFAAAIFLSLSAYGCSHIAVQEIPATADPTAEIGKLDAEVAAAEAQQINVLSPTNFRKASNALADAKKSRNEAQDTVKILDHVAEGRAYLGEANDTAKVSRPALGKVVQARSDAIAAGAPKTTEKEFKDVDRELADASGAIESGDLGVAEGARAQLEKRYADLELRAIKSAQLGAAAGTIDQALKEGAKENASRTLLDTQKTFAAAEAFISANRHDVAGIRAQADAATASANRLLTISRDAKVTDKKDAESVVLEKESQQKQIDAKAAELTTAAAAGARQAVALNDARDATLDMAAANGKLEAEKQEGLRLDAAKARFSPAEADVYRDGNQLIIRLKQLAFPSGKATLAGKNFALLGKVQKVIQDLGASHVTIEGHTDSNGAKATNQKLSDARATAISGYLAANGVAAGDLTAIGYGDTKPIASNGTNAGRAQNRRVDVIIKPAGVGH